MSVELATYKLSTEADRDAFTRPAQFIRDEAHSFDRFEGRSAKEVRRDFCLAIWQSYGGSLRD